MPDHPDMKYWRVTEVNSGMQDDGHASSENMRKIEALLRHPISFNVLKGLSALPGCEKEACPSEECWSMYVGKIYFHEGMPLHLPGCAVLEVLGVGKASKSGFESTEDD
jgi:hypothetical protein